MDEAKVASVLSEHLSMDFFITANADKQTRTKPHEIFLDNKMSQLHIKVSPHEGGHLFFCYPGLRDRLNLLSRMSGRLVTPQEIVRRYQHREVKNKRGIKPVDVT